MVPIAILPAPVVRSDAHREQEARMMPRNARTSLCAGRTAASTISRQIPCVLSRVSTRKHPSISIVSCEHDQRGCGLPARREHLAKLPLKNTSLCCTCPSVVDLVHAPVRLSTLSRLCTTSSAICTLSSEHSFAYDCTMMPNVNRGALNPASMHVAIDGLGSVSSFFWREGSPP